MKQSRKTTITQNRFTTFTRSWQGKTARLLPAFLILLILSCKDDATFIGFPKGARLNTHYVDIPLNPSVIQFDGVFTLNAYGDAITRILVGKYNDPQFGNMEAQGFSNIAPPVIPITPTVDAIYDSLVLQLNTDFYYYGSTSLAEQRLQVFRLTEPIYDSLGYYSNTTIAYDPTPLGETAFEVNTTDFDNALVTNADTDTTDDVNFSVRVKLGGTLGVSLLNDLVQSADPSYTVLSDYREFRAKYPGLAFIMPQSDKIIGINPAFTTQPTYKQTKLSLYYTDLGELKRADFVLYFGTNASTGFLNPVYSYSTITTDRSATGLNGIQGFKDFRPANNHTYVQSGTSLVGKFDLDHFYKYTDTLKNVIFNSAELVMSNVATQKLPARVQFRILDSTNHFRRATIDSLVENIHMVPVDSLVYDPYIVKMGTVLVFSDSQYPTMDIKTDYATAQLPVTDSQVTGVYMTEFFQQAFNNRHHPRRINSFAIMPVESEFLKSVNVLVLEPSPVLRLYYSQPVVNIR